MSPPNIKPNGQLRRSQVITTFGPGSLVDLTTNSAIIGGLDTWLGKGQEIPENRLVEKLKRFLYVKNLQLYAPPSDTQDPDAARTGITAWQFPEWFITQEVVREDPEGRVRSRRLVRRSALTKGKYEDDSKKKHPVVPIRFVRACPRGHIGDIHWSEFVHTNNPQCRRPLWIDERGTSGDISEIDIRCECGERQPLKSATLPGKLRRCSGDRPWLGPNNREECEEINRFLVRHASNAYFAQTMNVISLPDRDESLDAAVNLVWDSDLQYVESIEELQKDRTKKARVKHALEGYTDEEVLEEIEFRQGSRLEGPAKSVKLAEFEVLSNVLDSSGSDVSDSVFFARALPKTAWDAPWMKSVEKVVLVHRLREVVAQVGFTRFEAISTDTEGELDFEIKVKLSPLCREEPTWLPAVENRGEGIFIQFKKSEIDEWLGRDEVKKRASVLRHGFETWQHQHPQNKRKYRGIAQYLVHSISHLLLTAVSLECGYPASSIRERVYAEEYGYGILLYTGTPDAEGTLGGLVEAGRHIKDFLKSALENGKLCSNDPVCSQHEPQNTHEQRYLHGAACHGCLLIAETSCEQHNDLLDRALVVPTVDSHGTEFFREE